MAGAKRVDAAPGEAGAPQSKRGKEACLGGGKRAECAAPAQSVKRAKEASAMVGKRAECAAPELRRSKRGKEGE